jgi:uncharacterized protein Yka (UPF0111/DUF47 family)
MTDFDDFEVMLYGKDIRLVVQNGEQALNELRRSLEYIEKLHHQLKAKQENKVLDDLNSLFVELKMVESKVDEIYRIHHALYHDILRQQGE